MKVDGTMAPSPLHFQDHDVRFRDHDGQRWLCARDVCACWAVTIQQSIAKATGRLNPGQRVQLQVVTSGGPQMMTFVTLDRMLLGAFPHLEINAHSGQCDQVWMVRLNWMGVRLGWKTVGDAHPGLMRYHEAGLNLFVKWLPREQRRVLPLVAR